MMGTKTNSLSTMKHVIDSNQYNFVKNALWGLMENEDFTEIIITTNKDANYLKKVHGMIIDCFCKPPGLLNVSTDQYSTDKSLVLHHEPDVIEYVIIILYYGKCIVPVSMLTKFMDLSNYLKISEIFIYDERGSDYFMYLMHHKKKLLNYLCLAKKNCVNCDATIISQDLKYIPTHRTILAVYSPKFVLYYKNRIENKNPVLFYVVSNSVQIETILEYCYFGQIIFSKWELKDLMVLAKILGIDRLLRSFKFFKRIRFKNKFDLNIRNEFIIVKPPDHSDSVILENIKENSSNCYVYLWIKNKCAIIPANCFHSYNFKNDFIKLKNNIMYDVIIFHNNVNMNLVKLFIYCIYTKNYSTEMEQFIDLFGLQWPCSETNSSEKKIGRDKKTMYADSVEDLQTICDKVFKSDCSRDETIIQLFNCQICGIQLLSRKAFVIHSRGHQDDRVLCEECGQFMCESRFLDHKQYHKDNNNIQCEICLRHYSRAYGLKLHRRRSCCKKVIEMERNKGRNKAKKFYCSDCNKNFKSKQWLKIHRTSSHEFTTVECIYCHLTFPCKSKLRSHIQEAHYTNFYCSFCTEYFKTKVQLSKHTFEVHSSTYAKCHVCGQTFARYDLLQIHLRNKHPNEKPHRCKFCHKSFSRYDTMYYHMQMVHDGRRFVCPACNKNYSSKYYFVEHCWVRHQQFFNPNVCMVTREALPKLNPRNLFEQVVEVSEALPTETDETRINNDVINNDDDTIYSCTLCTLQFSLFNDLLSHLETHL